MPDKITLIYIYPSIRSVIATIGNVGGLDSLVPKGFDETITVTLFKYIFSNYTDQLTSPHCIINYAI